MISPIIMCNHTIVNIMPQECDNMRSHKFYETRKMHSGLRGLRAKANSLDATRPAQAHLCGNAQRVFLFYLFFIRYTIAPSAIAYEFARVSQKNCGARFVRQSISHTITIPLKKFFVLALRLHQTLRAQKTNRVFTLRKWCRAPNQIKQNAREKKFRARLTF